MITDFNIESEIKKNSLIMTPKGYINNNGGEQIAKEFSAQEANGIKKVILDLKDSKVVNSIGISYLIEIIEKLNEKDGKLVFVNLDPSIEKTFTIMGLFQFAEKANDIESAVE